MIIGITGGKGGTGKSSIAVALAKALSDYGRVLLVDCDVDCPNDHIMLGLDRKLLTEVKRRTPKINSDCKMCAKCGEVCKYNAIIAIQGKHPRLYSEQCNGCGACYHVCPHDAIEWEETTAGYIYTAKGKPELLAGELKENEKYSEIVVEHLKRQITSDYDYVIVDTAAGTHCDVISALEICDFALLVTEANPLGNHDLGLIKQLMGIMNKKYKIVLNKFDGNDIEEDAILKLPYSRDFAEKYADGQIQIFPEIKALAGRIKDEGNILVRN